ncbi:unnamed protein product [Prunus armeniaca]
MLKSAKSSNFGRGSESGRFAQSFDVGLCVRQLAASAVGSFGRCLAPRKSVFLRQGRRRVCLGASRFDAGYARSIAINSFSGPIPKELGNLKELTILSFEFNNFSGTLPPELGTWKAVDSVVKFLQHLLSKSTCISVKNGP